MSNLHADFDLQYIVVDSAVMTRSVSRPEVVGGDQTWII